MIDVTVNYLAVIAGTLVYMVLGFLWYGPLFGKQWTRLVGMTKEHQIAMKNKGMGKTYALSMVSALVMNYVLARIISYSQATTVMEGIQVGVCVWVGFVAVSMLSGYLYTVKPKPWTLYFIESGYYLAALVISGAILSVWI